MSLDATQADRVLQALGEQLASRPETYELVVIGGSGLIALGVIDRATRDVDIVALRQQDRLVNPSPLPSSLERARDRVARDFGLPLDWLNAAPASLLDFGLPEGFTSRLQRRDYGPSLVVWFADRVDQIHLKLYTTVDQGPGKHEQDLHALEPTDEELLLAARWTRTHDPSAGFHQELIAAMVHFGVENAAARL